MTTKSTGEILTDQLNEKIKYEWDILGDAYERKFIRGMYTSLERLVKLYKQRDIKA